LNTLLPSTTDYLIEADVKVNSESSGGLHGLVGRAADFNNGYWFGIHINSEGVPEHWALWKRVNGTWKQVAIKYTSGNFVLGKWYHLGMSFSGNQIKLYIDNKEVWSGYDSSIKGKKFGLNAHAMSIDFDNVRVIQN
jgi:hypothetical protein